MPAFEVSEIEARAEDGPHYSYRTLERLRDERPEDEFFFLIGADSLVDLPTWRHPERIAAAATIVVVNRPGIDAPLDRPPRPRPWHPPAPGRDDPPHRHRLYRPPPPRRRGPEHPVSGSEGGRGVHPRTGALPFGGSVVGKMPVNVRPDQNRKLAKITWSRELSSAGGQGCFPRRDAGLRSPGWARKDSSFNRDTRGLRLTTSLASWTMVRACSQSVRHRLRIS